MTKFPTCSTNSLFYNKDIITLLVFYKQLFVRNLAWQLSLKIRKIRKISYFVFMSQIIIFAKIKLSWPKIQRNKRLSNIE